MVCNWLRRFTEFRSFVEFAASQPTITGGRLFYRLAHSHSPPHATTAAQRKLRNDFATYEELQRFSLISSLLMIA